MAWPSNFVFDVEIYLENIYVPVQFQGDRANFKVAAAKNGRMQVWAPLRQSLIDFVAIVTVPTHVQ